MYEAIKDKAFRHELYKLALEAYEHPNIRWFGLCSAIEQAFHFKAHGRFVTYGTSWGFDRVWPQMVNYPELYPEIMGHKPEEPFCNDYWFPLGHRAVRIAILNAAIAETL